MARAITRSGNAVFESLHDARIACAVDFASLDPGQFAPALLHEARHTWQERVTSELRSAQIMTRFLGEMLGAGDPIDVYAGAIELVEDELRHVALCVQVCGALGAPALLPDPVELRDSPAFLAAPMAERALATAITMLAVNETMSTAYIEDLRSRCNQAAIRRVLDLTIGDEDEHEAFGWAYVEASLRRFPASTLSDWKHVAANALQVHRENAAGILAEIDPARRSLDAWPDEERAPLALFSPQRQGLVTQIALDTKLLPRLRAIGLA